MSRNLSDLVRQTILGRHKNGPWGYVPFPPSIPKVGQGGGLPDPGRVQSRAYGALKRHRERQKPLGWPFGRHNLIELEQHFRAVMGETMAVRMILSQADAYVRAFRNNIRNVGARLGHGARAFVELWRYVQEQSRASCETCRTGLKAVEESSSRNLR